MKLYDFINGNMIIIEGNPMTQINILLHSKFRIKGQKNTIIVREIKIYKSVFTILGNNNLVSIGKDCSIQNMIFRTDGSNNKIIIGNNVYLGGGGLNALDYSKIEIGDDCMFSHDIDIMSGDGHPIYYGEKRNRYNKGKNIIIGKHVWLGMHVQILKGVFIADNCIVGAGSVVTKSCKENNCIIGGYPAKILKKQVNWKR